MPLELAYAPWNRRIVSGLIDVFVISALSAPFLGGVINRLIDEAATSGPASAGDLRLITLVSIAVQVTYFTCMHAFRGSTVGKMATRTMLVRDDGSKVTPAVAFVRAVTLLVINFVSGFLLFVPVILNELRPLTSPRRQTFHDQIARTVVVVIDRSVKSE